MEWYTGIYRTQDYIGFWGLGMAAVTLQQSTGKNISCIGKTATDPS